MLKAGPLDADEWKVMQTHPAIGAQIIGEHKGGLLAMARQIALTHHEKWDGSGYPSGLSGEAIPLEGRIVAIADTFDALMTVRPYKKAWSLDQAIDYLREQRGRHFQAELVDLFLENMTSVCEIMERWTEDLWSRMRLGGIASCSDERSGDLAQRQRFWGRSFQRVMRL